MRKPFAFIFLFCVLAMLAPRAWADDATATPAPTKDDLQAMIDAKSQDLQKINQQLTESENNLQSTRSQRQTLQKEMNTLVGTISQLQLSIQADNVSSQKLGLEIDSLSYDIHDSQLSIASKQETIEHILRELQTSDDVPPLVSFLRHDTLADAIMDTQSLTDLRTQLSSDVKDLAALQMTMGQKIKDSNDKKTRIAIDQQNAIVKKSLVEDQKQTRTVILAQTKDQESAYEQQVADLQKQQNSVEDEISQVEDNLKAQFNPDVLPTPRHGVFNWPVTMRKDGGKGIITQHFGQASTLYRGKPHNGLDIGVPIGTPVYAAADGVIMAVDNNDKSTWAKYQYGKYVLIKHPNNIATLYGHLSKQVVSVGQTVKQGDLLGYSGTTGYSTGPHVHFGAYWVPTVELKAIPPAAGLVPVGVLVNPENYLPAQ